MKKTLFAIMACALALFSSCSSEVQKTNIEQYVQKLVEQYPNYQSNDIARKAVQDSIEARMTSFIGKVPTDIDGLAFRFEELKEDEGEHGAIFSARPYLVMGGDNDADIAISVFGVVSEGLAGQLDRNKQYAIKGTLASWSKDIYFLRGGDGLSTIDFGTLFLDNISVSVIEQ